MPSSRPNAPPQAPHERPAADHGAHGRFYPDRETSRGVARGLLDGGCAYLEIQFPFSDPTADGPDIQAACTAALAAGFTIAEGFRLVSEIHRDAGVPIFLMSYANLLFTHGMEKFLRKCRESGAAGVIFPIFPRTTTKASSKKQNDSAWPPSP